MFIGAGISTITVISNSYVNLPAVLHFSWKDVLADDPSVTFKEAQLEVNSYDLWDRLLGCSGVLAYLWYPIYYEFNVVLLSAGIASFQWALSFGSEAITAPGTLWEIRKGLILGKLLSTALCRLVCACVRGVVGVTLGQTTQQGLEILANWQYKTRRAHCRLFYKVSCL